MQLTTTLLLLTPALTLAFQKPPTIASAPSSFWANIYQDGSSCDGKREAYVTTDCHDYNVPTSGAVKLIKGEAITAYSGPGCTGHAFTISKNSTAGACGVLGTGFDVASWKAGVGAANATM